MGTWSDRNFLVLRRESMFRGHLQFIEVTVLTSPFGRSFSRFLLFFYQTPGMNLRGFFQLFSPA